MWMPLLNFFDNHCGRFLQELSGNFRQKLKILNGDRCWACLCWILCQGVFDINRFLIYECNPFQFHFLQILRLLINQIFFDILMHILQVIGLEALIKLQSINRQIFNNFGWVFHWVEDPYVFLYLIYLPQPMNYYRNIFIFQFENFPLLNYNYEIFPHFINLLPCRPDPLCLVLLISLFHRLHPLVVRNLSQILAL